MDVVGGLGLLVSVLLGVLLALVIDSYTLGRQLQAAVSKNRRLQQKVRKLAARLVRTHREMQTAQVRARQLGGELAAAGEQIEQVTAENHALQRQVEAARTEISTLQGNLSRLDVAVEQLESQGQSLRRQLEVAAGEKQTLAGELTGLESKLDALRQEHQDVCQKLAVAEVEMKHLGRELEEARVRAGQVRPLQTENQALARKVQAAEERVEELKAQVQSLQGKLGTVRQVLDYTGKNQLRLIRGIGPTYARRLNEAGIHTLNDLARQSPERVREIVELKQWQAVEPEEWIDEAQALSVKLDGEGVRPATADSQPATTPSQSVQ